MRPDGPEAEAYDHVYGDVIGVGHSRRKTMSDNIEKVTQQYIEDELGAKERMVEAVEREVEKPETPQTNREKTMSDTKTNKRNAYEVMEKLNEYAERADAHETLAPPPTVWVAGVHKGESDLGNVWEIMGVFAREEDAAKACTTENHFVAPLPFGKILPEETVEWPGIYYPIPRREGK